MADGANVTKFNAGGSGDNVIADGYVRTVEKVWLDSYDLSDTASTNTTISIAVLPENKKITGVDVSIESTSSHTSATISIGFATDSAIDTLFPATNVTHNKTLSTLSLFGSSLGNLNSAAAAGKNGGFQKVTAGTQVTVAIKLNNFTMTNGTLKSIVRYT
jgi:hypothetical protein